MLVKSTDRFSFPLQCNMRKRLQHFKIALEMGKHLGNHLRTWRFAFPCWAIGLGFQDGFLPPPGLKKRGTAVIVQ